MKFELFGFGKRQYSFGDENGSFPQGIVSQTMHCFEKQSVNDRF